MTGPATGQIDVDGTLVGFTHALRAAGVPVTQDRTRGYLEAVRIVGIDDIAATYAAGRATLCAGPDDLARYDQVFHAWFTGETPPSGIPMPRTQTRTTLLPEADGSGQTGDEGEDDPIQARASAVEVLRHRDVAELDAAERARLTALIGRLRLRPPRRSSPRRRPHRRGPVDPGRTLRASLARMGEPGTLHHRRRAVRPRRLILLVDVSGSMSPYAEVLLRVGHRLRCCGAELHVPVEVFTLGTRLTRLTRPLSHRDADRALVAAGEAVPDWSGGTRLGETLRAFAARYAGLARGAVVVIASDGWERGEVDLLAAQTARLSRLAHRTVWLNPHRGKAGYEPVQRGVMAVLPHVDDFVAGHSLATYEELLEVIADA